MVGISSHISVQHPHVHELPLSCAVSWNEWNAGTGAHGQGEVDNLLDEKEKLHRSIVFKDTDFELFSVISRELE